VTYLGEWHSHPERNPSPSTIGHADWSKQLRKQKRNLVFIIVTLRSGPPCLGGAGP
jgi:hypothetical protein